MVSIEKISKDVKDILRALDDRLVYHNMAHTFDWVYKYSVILAKAAQLPKHDIYNIAVAALFHDVGFIKQYSANEPIAVEMLRAYAVTNSLDIPESQFEMMCDAIINTNMQSLPTTMYAKILRDADMSPQGHADFPMINDKLRQEALNYPGTYLHPLAQSNTLWKRQQLEFMQQHRWFTESATRIFETQKQINLALVARWRE